jgi:hypothetical protein
VAQCVSDCRKNLICLVLKRAVALWRAKPASIEGLKPVKGLPLIGRPRLPGNLPWWPVKAAELRRDIDDPTTDRDATRQVRGS